MLCASCGAELEGETAACPKCRGATLLDDRYRLLAVLGRGANGITYRAERALDGHAFAVKEIPLRTLEGAKAMELFEREARVLRELAHPAIPKYEDDFVWGEGKSSALYLVQELVRGQTLEEEARGERYDAAAVLAIVAEIADILAYLHGRSPPVIHRDVKPKNVMRRAEGGLVLIDFGSVRDAMSAGGGSTVAGTFGYMAPEQLAGKASPASDVYALGALAMALLTRKEPDTLLGDDHRLDARAHVTAPEHVLALLEDMLEPSPTRRLASAEEVAKRARTPAPRAKTREPQPPPKAAEPAVPAKPARDRERLTYVLVGLAILGLPALLVALRLRGKETRLIASSAIAAMPELYARPLVVDVNSDGREDIIVVSVVERSADDARSDEQGRLEDHGEFDAVVQAIDPVSGRVHYAIPVGEAYQFSADERKTSPRVVLMTKGDRLGIARVAARQPVELTIHKLATGERIESAKLPVAGGRACALDGSAVVTFAGFFELDLASKNVHVRPESSCPAWSQPSIADVPDSQPRSTTGLQLPYSELVDITTGPHAGKTAAVVPGRRDAGWLASDDRVSDMTTDDAPVASSRDNGRMSIVRLEPEAGRVVAARTLEELGFPRERLVRVEALPAGALLFFANEDGLARVDAQARLSWALPLPKKAALARYTIGKTHAYLHVYEKSFSDFGYASKALRARLLVVDLETGRYVRSIPEGPLGVEPRAPAPPVAASVVAPETFRPLCTCKDGDAGTVVVTQASEAKYALDLPGGTGFPLPNVRAFERSDALAVACRGDLVIIAGEHAMTAWSREKKAELWTAIVPASAIRRPEREAGAPVACAAGQIQNGRFFMPVPGATLEFDLADGRLVGGRPR